MNINKIKLIFLHILSIFLFSCGNTLTTSIKRFTTTSQIFSSDNYVLSVGSKVNIVEDNETKLINEINITSASVIWNHHYHLVSSYVDNIQIPISYDPINDTYKYKNEAIQVNLAKGKNVLSKRELGDNYGMKGDTFKGNWYEQVNVFQNVIKGLVFEEIKEFPNKPTEGDELYNAGCSISINDFVFAIEVGLEDYHKVNFLSSGNVKAGLGITISSASNNISIDIIGVAINENIIQCANIDTYQIPLKNGILDNSDNNKQITLANEKKILTKKELHDEYGMKGDAFKGNWYEQIAVYERYISNKTIEEIKSIDSNIDSELFNAGCSINVATFINGLEEASVHHEDSSYNGD